MPELYWPEPFRKLGVKPVINAQSWVTALGGSEMHPEVLRAMDDAARAFVDVEELHRAAGKFVAQVCQAEAGLVTAGCAAANVLMVAACMTGNDPGKVDMLPDTSRLKNEVVLYRGMRNSYDRTFELAGARLVEYGGIRSARSWQLESAITDKTCAVAVVFGPFIDRGIGLEETVRIAHERGVPVIVDASAEVPPRENLSKFIKMGADLVSFSGGKGIRGPQNSGMMAGRADLIEAAALNSIVLTMPRAGVGRAMKVSKETIVGLVTALEICIDTDEQAEFAGWRAKATHVVDRVKGIPGLRAIVEEHSDNRQGPQAVIYFESGWKGPKPSEIRKRLAAGEPSIRVGGGGYMDEINIVMVNVRDGEEKIIADRLLAALK